MLKLAEIRQLQIELSTKCNARCPMCMRNYRGMDYNGGYPEVELSLSQVQKILQPDFLKQIQVSFNGNVDAKNGLDVIAGAFTMTGTNIDLDPTTTFTLDMDASQTVTLTIADNLDSSFVDFSTNFNFLCVAQWGPRKNLPNTIRLFLDEFKNDKVGLVCKVNNSNNSLPNVWYIVLSSSSTSHFALNNFSLSSYFSNQTFPKLSK